MSINVLSKGQTQGLSLILNTEEQENVPAPRENIGFKVLVHPRHETPNLQDYGIELLTGTHTPIRLDVTEMYSLPAPYGDCATEDAITLKYYQGPYTENQCYLECETDYIVDKCGCRHFYMPGIKSEFECYLHIHYALYFMFVINVSIIHISYFRWIEFQVY